MAIQPPENTTALEEKSAKNRKLYLARLHDQGLPTVRAKRKTATPDQFQIAQLAAAIGNRSGRKEGLFELGARALRLWDAAGRALWVGEQTDLVCRGVLYYDRQDWWTHAQDLVNAFSDDENSQPGQMDDTTDEEFNRKIESYSTLS